ncbi:hypothetical protein ES703_27374 [subsurface metagenome]
MNIRSRELPEGWYPGTKSGVSRQIDEFLKSISKSSGLSGAELRLKQKAVAGIAPHAGWAFSGQIALMVMQRMSPETETFVVVGGHLLPSEGVLAAFEDGYETPSGVIKADLDLLEYLRLELDPGKDSFADNTVEVQLPFIKHLFPESRVLGLRAAPSQGSVHLGEILEKASKVLNRRIAVIGSTDLTYYGPNYGFIPKGLGREAVRWVKEINDRRIIESLVNLDLSGALERGVKEKSACSIGGAVAAVSFARAAGAKRGELLHYTTSYDLYPNESFVGYAGIIFPGNA